MKLFISVFIYVNLICNQSRQQTVPSVTTAASSEEEEKDDGDSALDDVVDGEAAYTGDDDANDSSLDSYYEPFDPEKNGYLLHEYFDQAYEKFPDYDIATMKLNLNYFGDLLLLEKNKDQVDDGDPGDRFTLDPEERERYDLKETEESNSDIQEEMTNDSDDTDTDSEDADSEDNTNDRDNNGSEGKQVDNVQADNDVLDNESEDD